MDIVLLKTFLEVSKTRHFGKAAENLCISQSAVSARIRLLEDEVGQPLFIRKRNDIQTTAAGNKLLQYADSIIVNWKRLCQEIALDDETKRVLAVGGVPSLWDSVLQDWLLWLLEHSPEFSVNIEAHGHEVLIRMLEDGVLDFAFVFDAPPVLMGYEVQEISRLPLVMVSSRQDLSASDIGDDYIYVDWGTSFSIRHTKIFPDMRAPRLRMSLGRLAFDFILLKGGTAYLPEPMVEEALANRDLYRVADVPVINREAYVVYRDSQEQDLASRVLEFFNKRG